MSFRVRRTYGSKASRTSFPASDPPSGLSSPPPEERSPCEKRKRPLLEEVSVHNTPADVSKRQKKHSSMSSLPKKPKLKSKQTTFSVPTSQVPKPKPSRTLTQLHFALDTSILRTCRVCNLSYTIGAPDDESLHRAHCARVQRGAEWGKEEERERLKAGVEEVEMGIRVKDGRKGRIVCFRADVGGKIGTKVATLLQTIDLALSSPPLPPSILRQCKIYLFLLPSPSATATAASGREKIAGCVIAQRISTAMAVVDPQELQSQHDTELELEPEPEPEPEPQSRRSLEVDERPKARDEQQHEEAPQQEGQSTKPSHPSHYTIPNPQCYSRTQSLIPLSLTPTHNLYLDPKPLPTPLGISRLFVPTVHRRQGIASLLLDAAARTFIHGCPLEPTKGEVAFTQPTEGGAAVMRKWGKDGVRVYEE